MLFLGEYEHALDPKRRLAVPAEVRSGLNPAIHGAGFVGMPGPNGSLWLWPEKTFAMLAEKLGGSLLADESLTDFERHVFSKAAALPLDGAGRIRIPERLLSQHGLTDKVMILGVRDHLELCSPQHWQQEQARLAPAAGDIWRKARAAMSNKDQRA